MFSRFNGVLRPSVIGLILIASCHTAEAQRPLTAVKNNLLYDATLTPNLGIERSLGRHFSAQLFYGIHPWQFSETRKLRHWVAMPELRFWPGGAMNGHFFGLHALAGQYNVAGMKFPLGSDAHYEGWMAGGGLTYGYAWQLSCRWNLEAAVGVGYIFTRRDKYVNEECGALLGRESRRYLGPTKLALSISYVFGRQCKQPLPVMQRAEPEGTNFVMSLVVPEVEAEKARALTGKAFLDFVVNRTDINPTYRGNAKELAKVQQTIDVVRHDPNATITAIDIHGYASPEGSFENNVRLAKGRAEAFLQYVKALYDDGGVNFTVESTPEDWAGLLPHLSPEMLAIARDETLSPDRKEQRMKSRYPQEWQRLLKDVLPALRHSDYTVSYTVRPFTVEEARELIKTKPQQLSLNEMFLVAKSYPVGSEEYCEAFETAVHMFPNDEVANLNAAYISLHRKDLAAAERRLARCSDTPQVLNARGMLAVLQNRREEARRLFLQAEQGGCTEATQNLKLLGLMKP